MNRLCREASAGKPCIQRKPTTKMTVLDGKERHKVCAEIIEQLRADGVSID